MRGGPPPPLPGSVTLVGLPESAPAADEGMWRRPRTEAFPVRAASSSAARMAATSAACSRALCVDSKARRSPASVRMSAMHWRAMGRRGERPVRPGEPPLTKSTRTARTSAAAWRSARLATCRSTRGGGKAGGAHLSLAACARLLVLLFLHRCFGRLGAGLCRLRGLRLATRHECLALRLGVGKRWGRGGS